MEERFKEYCRNCWLGRTDCRKPCTLVIQAIGLGELLRKPQSETSSCEGEYHITIRKWE